MSGMTSEELALFNEATALAERLWEKTKQVSGLNSDPKMFSCALFKRLHSNHRGFIALYNKDYLLEAEIILRSGIEAAICIAANQRMGSAFVELMKQDAAATVLGQIKAARDNDAGNMVRDGEAMFRMLKAKIDPAKKPAKLDWKSLADEGHVPQLYGFHRNLSGVSSHVTGLSILRSFGGDGLSDRNEELTALGRRMRPMMMVGATLQGSMIHGAMLDDAALVADALVLTKRLSELSEDWPGVKKEPKPGQGR